MTFCRPFVLASHGTALPPGTYDVATEEEQIDGVSFPAYRRLQTYLVRRATRGEPESSTTLIVDLDELELAHEQERSSDLRKK